MTDRVITTGTAARPGAKIYQFPDRRHSTSSASADEVPRAVTVPWCGGWYHEVAIDDEHTKPVAGPAA